MSHPYEYHNFIMYALAQTTEHLTVLDVGCGLGIWGYLLRAGRKDMVTLVGLDVARPYLSFVRERHVYDALLRCDAAHLPFKDHVFDYVLAAEVLEHLNPSAGRAMLHEIERCCRGRTILTTPNGFKPQEIDGSPWETHKSGWTSNELRSMGYKVRGIGNRLFPLKKNGVLFWAVFHYLSTPLAQILPSIAEYLIAVKDVGKSSLRYCGQMQNRIK